MNYDSDVSIPSHVLDDLYKYRAGQHPYECGGFMTAVLANDLVGAFERADDRNKDLMYDYVSFLYNDLPARTGNPAVDMWGSYAAVRNTIQRQVDANRCEDDGN